jgi:hypothetical protein
MCDRPQVCGIAKAARTPRTAAQQAQRNLARRESHMLQFDLLRDRGVLVLSPNGSLEKADFERLCREIDPYIAENGKLTGIMVCVKSFPRWESLGAMVAHLKFVRDHHRNIGRIAAVTDSELLGS